MALERNNNNSNNNCNNNNNNNNNNNRNNNNNNSLTVISIARYLSDKGEHTVLYSMNRRCAQDLKTINITSKLLT